MCGRVLLMSNFISLLLTKPKLVYKALPLADAWSTTLVHKMDCRYMTACCVNCLPMPYSICFLMQH